MKSKRASKPSSAPALTPDDARAKLAERIAEEALAGDLLQAIRAYRVGLEETGNDLLFAGELGKRDLFFLLWYLLHRQDMEDPWIYERTREVQRDPDGYLDLWAREHYKDLADDTPMLTANRGWTTHGQLGIGDLVYAPSGEPVRVVAVSSRYADSRCYRLTFSDGAQLVAGAGHLWRVRRKVRRRVANGRAVEWVQEIRRTADLGERCDVGTMEAPIRGAAAQRPVHPYVLGCWLGDGCSASGRIGCADPEIFERIAALGYRLSESHCAGRAPFEMRTVYGMQPVLRALGVLGDKHIPAEYMHASAYQRMELLRGLMDTDGHCNTRGTATFSNQNERLARQVWELAVGLALRPRLRRYDGQAAPFWQVSMQVHTDRNPFALARKAGRAIEPSAHRNCRDVVAVEEVASVPTRCIQVDGGMYLAGRELVPTHNSTIITFGLTIQDIVNNPEETFGIFSHTRPIAKTFLRQIKTEFESNDDLKAAYPDVLYDQPHKQSPKWSEDDGIVVKRKGNPRESTVEAWGVVDGMPISKHFGVLVYDDLLDPKSVTGPEMIKKTTDMWALSLNLGRRGGRRRTIGTRYHTADTYREMMERKSVKPRIYKATDDGTETGTPVLLTPEELAAKRRDMGPYIFGSQMMQDPTADKAQGFKEDWLRYWPAERFPNLNIYLLVDPAGKKKKTNDYSVFTVVGLGPDRNYYVLRWVRDRLNLAERTKTVFKLHRQYKPRGVGYEEYGMQSDIDSIKDTQEATNYRFDVVALGGPLDNEDRVKLLVPLFEQGRIWIPQRCDFVDYQQDRRDLTREFVYDEYLDFPVARHDDMLVSLARVLDKELAVEWPKEILESEMPKWMQAMLAREQLGGSWMSR